MLYNALIRGTYVSILLGVCAVPIVGYLGPKPELAFTTWNLVTLNGIIIQKWLLPHLSRTMVCGPEAIPQHVDVHTTRIQVECEGL
jgi:hypothetical protein